MVRRLPTIDVGVAIAGRDESKAMPLMDAEESPAKAISEHDASPEPLAKMLNESSPSQPKVPSASLALLAAVQTQKENKAQEKQKDAEEAHSSRFISSRHRQGQQGEKAQGRACRGKALQCRLFN